jgi:hypothetical protein
LFFIFFFFFFFFFWSTRAWLFFAGALELELGDGNGKQTMMEMEAGYVKMQIQNWLCSGPYPI